jgi:hypothetical protein
MPITQQQLLELGARARYNEIRDEIGTLQEEGRQLLVKFPAIARATSSNGQQQQQRAAGGGLATPTPKTPPTRTTASDAPKAGPMAGKPMTRAQRKAVSERMKRYWAERRQARAATATAEDPSTLNLQDLGQ